MIYLYIYLFIGFWFGVFHGLLFVHAAMAGGVYGSHTSSATPAKLAVVFFIAFIMAGILWPVKIVDYCIKIFLGGVK